MKEVPDISIITSTYNSKPYLTRYFGALKKVNNNLTRNRIKVEIVIVFNDAIKSERLELERFINNESENNDVVINPIFVPLESLYRSWNRGINASSGDCICFWNVDDIRFSKALLEGIHLIKNNAKLVYFPHRHIHKRKINISINKIFKKVLKPFGIKFQLKNFIFSTTFIYINWTKRKLVQPPSFDRVEFTRSFHCGPFFMFHRSLFQKLGPFDEQFKIAGDFEWCVRATKITEFVRADRIAGKMIIDGTNLTGRSDPIHVVENNVIYLRHRVLDKVEDVDKKLMQEYSIHKIQCSGNGYGQQV